MVAAAVAMAAAAGDKGGRRRRTMLEPGHGRTRRPLRPLPDGLVSTRCASPRRSRTPHPFFIFLLCVSLVGLFFASIYCFLSLHLFFFSLSIVLCLGLCLYVRFFVAASMSSNAYYVAACVVDSRATDAGKRQGQLRREESERPREAGGGVQPGVGMGGAHPTMRKVQRLVPPTFFAHQCVPQVISSGGALPEGES